MNASDKTIRTAVRDLGPDDGPRMSEELHKQSRQTIFNRFHYHKKEFTPKELEGLTHPDGKDHIALILQVLGDGGEVWDMAGIIRCVRDAPGAEIAEVAVVLKDDWQRKGLSRVLARALARRCLEVGILCWRATIRRDNIHAAKVFAPFGEVVEEKREEECVVITYRLKPEACG